MTRLYVLVAYQTISVSLKWCIECPSIQHWDKCMCILHRESVEDSNHTMRKRKEKHRLNLRRASECPPDYRIASIEVRLRCQWSWYSPIDLTYWIEKERRNRSRHNSTPSFALRQSQHRGVSALECYEVLHAKSATMAIACGIAREEVLKIDRVSLKSEWWW